MDVFEWSICCHRRSTVSRRYRPRMGGHSFYQLAAAASMIRSLKPEDQDEGVRADLANLPQDLELVAAFP